MDVDNISGDQLKQFVERLERLESDKQNVLEDIKQVFSEAKGNGFDPKIIRQVLKIRKMDRAELYETQELLIIYQRALGMIIREDE